MLGSDKIRILHVNIKENKVIQIAAEAGGPVSDADILHFKEEICDKLGYEQVELDLNQLAPPSYRDNPDCESFWEEYLSGLRIKSPSVWALLEGSKLCEKNSSELTAVINKNLCSILKMKQVDKLAAAAFSERFGRQVSLDFVYQEQAADQKEAEKKNTAEVPFSIEQYQASVRQATGTENSYTRVYGGGGGQGRGYNRGDGKSSKRRRITPEEGAALPKDAEGCDIILGKAITDPITLMKDISSDSGYVAVKGRVFHAETKPIPSGSVIALIQMTDETYSCLLYTSRCV